MHLAACIHSCELESQYYLDFGGVGDLWLKDVGGSQEEILYPCEDRGKEGCLGIRGLRP